MSDISEAKERLKAIQDSLEEWVRPSNPTLDTRTAVEFLVALNARGLKIVRRISELLARNLTT